MTRQWIGCTSEQSRDELERALQQVNPQAHLVFAWDAADIRCRFRDEEPRTVGAIVGLSDNGVSDVNLAAALAADGRASEVVLVARFVTGSLRSRASQAGISRVIDIDDVLFDDLVESAVSHEPEPPITSVASSGGGNHAPIVVFASGRGGIGKTSLAAVSAVVAAHWGMRVSVCDLDLACGNLPSRLGIPRWRDPSSFVRDGQLDRASAMAAGSKVAEGIELWGPCERPEMAERVMPAAGNLLEALSEEYDLVLVDTSSTCTDAVAQAMQASDRLVLLHDREPDAISSLARVSALAVRLGVARARIVRVECGCQPRMVGAPFVPMAEVGLETARAFRIPDGGDEVSELLAAGQAEELRELGGDYVRSVSALLASLLKELGCLPDCEAARRAAEEPRRRGPRSLFSRRKEVA